MSDVCWLTRLRVSKLKGPGGNDVLLVNWLSLPSLRSDVKAINKLSLFTTTPPPPCQGIGQPVLSPHSPSSLFQLNNTLWQPALVSIVG